MCSERQAAVGGARCRHDGQATSAVSRALAASAAAGVPSDGQSIHLCNQPTLSTEAWAAATGREALGKPRVLGACALRLRRALPHSIPPARRTIPAPRSSPRTLSHHKLSEDCTTPSAARTATSRTRASRSSRRAPCKRPQDLTSLHRCTSALGDEASRAGSGRFPPRGAENRPPGTPCSRTAARNECPAIPASPGRGRN